MTQDDTGNQTEPGYEQKSNIDILNERLPSDFTGEIKKMPIIAFAHCVVTLKDGVQFLIAHPVPATHSCKPYANRLQRNEKVETVTPAPPGGFLYSLRLKGPGLTDFDNEILLGYSYMNEPESVYFEKALEICQDIKTDIVEAIDFCTPENLDKLLKVFENTLPDSRLKNEIINCVRNKKDDFGPDMN